jgi:hypothetical protein
LDRWESDSLARVGLGVAERLTARVSGCSSNSISNVPGGRLSVTAADARPASSKRIGAGYTPDGLAVGDAVFKKPLALESEEAREVDGADGRDAISAGKSANSDDLGELLADE